MQIDLFGHKPCANERRKDWRWAIPKLLQEQGDACIVCAEKIKGTTGAYVWVEHVHPIAQGGSDTWDNLALSHPHCNRLRGDRWLDDPWLQAHVPKLRELAKQAQKDRHCIRCDASIADRGCTAVYCEACKRLSDEEGWQESQRIHGDKKRVRVNMLYKFSPDYRERKKARGRRANPVVRERANKKKRDRYRDDPEYQENCKLKAMDHHRRNREAILARRRARHAANKDAINAKRRADAAQKRAEQGA